MGRFRVNQTKSGRQAAIGLTKENDTLRIVQTVPHHRQSSWRFAGANMAKLPATPGRAHAA
jgi:hypothetical protein